MLKSARLILLIQHAKIKIKVFSYIINSNLMLPITSPKNIGKNIPNSLLLHDHEIWKKKEQVSSFKVTVDNYDREELCQMISKYNQSLLERIFLKEQIGLYRDNLTFKLTHDFKTEITTNLPEAYSVDETFDLINNTDCLLKTKQK